MPAIETPTTETPAFDAKAFMESRNEGKTIEPPKPVDSKPPAAAEPEDHQPRLPRSVRREMNKLREEIGSWKTRAELAEAGKATAPAAAPKEDAEPQRSAYGTDAEYLRATQKWDKAQEAKTSTKTSEETQQQEAFVAHLQAMDTKAAEDMKLLPDWDAVSKKAMEDEDAPEFAPAEHPTFVALLAQSDVKAFALYHFAKHPEQLEAMLELSKDPAAQIRSFHRLEGRLEKEYDSTQKAAQASEAGKPKEDRKHPAEAAKPGGTATGANPVKPKPSSEVAARGGSPAPDEPAIGSPAWMLKRNQEQFGR